MTSETTTVRSLSLVDLPAVIPIERRSFTSPWSLAMFVLELSKPSGICLAALLGERMTGYLICSRYADVWHLMNVAVDPAYRRHHVAQALMEEMIARAGPEAAYTLEVRTSNAPAIALYENFGFRSAGVRRRYYQDTGEDAMIMWRTSAVSSSSPPATSRP